MLPFARSLWLTLLLASVAPARHPLVVISVDGLDQRYLADADKLGLRIPHLRRLMKQGQWSQGVLGRMPTVTWPSHTTMISGVDPRAHGILGNRRPPDQGGDYYWTVDLLKVPTLLDAASKAGITTAGITWPVTVGAPLNWNLPEYFKKRRGGGMDLGTIGSKAQPADLVEQIRAKFPSFAQEWMDDRTRALATIYILQTHKPGLLLLHFVDLDSEAHDNGPFTQAANAILEYTDELIGQIQAAMPAGSRLVIVSDHGFERVDREVNLQAIAKQKGIAGITAAGGTAAAATPEAAGFLRALQKEARYGIGREIPAEEVRRFAPELAKSTAVFEPAPHYWFTTAPDWEVSEKPTGRGSHGHWPMRYRAVYLAHGPGIPAQRLPEIDMASIAARLAEMLELPFQPAAAK